MFNALISLLPLIALIVLMTKRNSMPSYKALPLAAGLLYLLELFWFHAGLRLVHATVIAGLLYAWTPILIIWGAIFLFCTMEHSGAMVTIRQWLDGITTNRIAQIMIVGWAFAFLIEGASGFGTPAALAAPILVELGFAPIQAALACLILNSVPVSFGAAGTPTWFGFGQLGLTHDAIIEIGYKSALIHAAAAMVIPLIALAFAVSLREIRRNIVFIYLSILACVIPYVALARYQVEFPALMGGGIGLIISVFLARHGIGLAPAESDAKPVPRVQLAPLIRATFPLWGTILLLLITRIDQFHLRQFLNAETPSINASLGPFGQLAISPSLVVSLKGILGIQGPDGTWSHKILYIPSILPFFAIGCACFYFLRMSRQAMRSAWGDSWQRIRRPILALLGALVFSRLLMAGGEEACTTKIGQALSRLTGRHWIDFAAYLGALGSFFAGSNTVSNLTFAGIQASIAQTLGLNLTTVLALQGVGGAMGIMVCISNIVATSSVLGIGDREGYILKRTFWPMVLYGIIAAMVGRFL